MSEGFYLDKSGLSDRAHSVLMCAERRMEETRFGFDAPTEILMSMQDFGGQGVWTEALESTGVKTAAIREHIRSHAPRKPRLLNARLKSEAQEVITRSVLEANLLGQYKAGYVALLLALMGQDGSYAGQMLLELGANLDRTRQEAERLLRQQFDRFTRDLTRAANDGELAPVIGRDKEILSILSALSRDSSNVPVLVGQPGVGKTSVVHGLAQRIATGNVPPEFADVQVHQVDLRAAVNAATARGEPISLMSVKPFTQPNVLVFLDDDQLRKYKWPRIPAATGPRLIGVRTADPAARPKSLLGRIFQYRPPSTHVEITVEEVSVEQTIRILESRRGQVEKRYQLSVTDSAMAAAARYASERGDGLLPGTASALLLDAIRLGRLRGLGSIDEKTVAGVLGVAPGEIEELPEIEPPEAEGGQDGGIWDIA